MTAPVDADFERRFGGLRRLYGVNGAQRLFESHVVVVGIGGVGSWAVEALARSGVKRLTLIDLDHISESNINRQIHATSSTLGQAKTEAMRERIASIHPTCRVDTVEEFVAADNWPGLIETAPGSEAVHPSAVIDACDQVRAKTALAAWSLSNGVPLVSVGAAGGKRQPERIEVADLGDTTHDPLLAQLRYRLRKHHSAPRSGRMGLACVYSREPVAPPDASCGMEVGDGSLNCHGYGSVVSVTAAFGFCAAGWVMNAVARGSKKSPGASRRAHSDAII